MIDKKLVLDAFASYNEAKSAIRKEKKHLKTAKQFVKATQEAISVAQTVAQKLQTMAHDRISGIVSQCLSDIFDEPTEFKIIWDRKRGKTEGRMVYIRNGQEVDPLSSDGGSAVEISAFAMRIANLVVSNKHRRKFLAFDEPFLALDDKHVQRVQKMIMTLCKELDLQIILITHNPKLECGKIIRIP